MQLKLIPVDLELVSGCKARMIVGVDTTASHPDVNKILGNGSYEVNEA